MKAMNFYTANGWAGSNYDSKLSTKEVAAKVKSYAKKNFPDFKFSVRSEWSIYTDSMYIELKAGTCIPFVEGSRSAERGYMSTMSSVKAWKDELTPEMFKVLDAVVTYASSFRYDDSDGMQDYYDTNFYLKIKVSDEYKVIEPKAKKSSVKAEKVEEVKEVEAVTVEGIEGMEFYEKKVKGKRYITENRTKRGYYVIDTLDNCPVGFFQTKEEAEREAETLNGFTDGNGRLKTVI